MDERIRCVVYTGDYMSPEDIMAKVQRFFSFSSLAHLSLLTSLISQFGITLIREVQFVRLFTRTLLDGRHYPFLTIISQSLASMVLSFLSPLSFPPLFSLPTHSFPPLTISPTPYS
jgi:hypothetical protein